MALTAVQRNGLGVGGPRPWRPPDPVLSPISSQEAPCHLHPGRRALPPERRAHHARRRWGSLADPAPRLSVVVSIPGALCLRGHGPHLCPRHSLRPGGHLGPCSRTQTPSGTPRLPTPSRGDPRTAGHRPKTWVPRLRGHLRQGPNPQLGCLEELSHTLEGSPHPTSPWGSGTLHCTGSLHTGGGPAPPHLPPVGLPPTPLSRRTCPTGA